MKEKYSAVLLASFGGGIGLHKFYLGKIASGVLYAIFAWTFIPFLLSLIDRLYYLFMDQETFDAKYNSSTKRSANVEHKVKVEDKREVLVCDPLKEAKELLDDGAITDEEYKAIGNAIKKNLE